MTTTTNKLNWWQWLLVYPSFGVAFFTAVPTVTDKALAVYHDTNTDTYSQASAQAALWEKNADCSATARLTPNSIPGDLKTLATAACPSGDLLVRASGPGRPGAYHWVAYDEIVRPVAAAGGLIPEAKASPARLPARPQARPAARGPARLQLAMLQTEQAICQRKVDARTMVRRVRTGQGCFDEHIDMYSGTVTARRPAPCTPNC